MVAKTFRLQGQEGYPTRSIDIGSPNTFEDVQFCLAANYTIPSAKGIGFRCNGKELMSLDEILDHEPISITVDGHAIRDPGSPEGIIIFGNHFELYPDHLGNHQRLFARYGTVIKTNNMGRVCYLTNDPDIASLAFKESELFTKKPSDPDHPLYGIRDETALFLCDTESPAFKASHKFIPPSMSPKAVRHYTPLLQECVEASFHVFDEFDAHDQAFNVYSYMMKMAGQVICKLVLGVDLHHFDTVDAPIHHIILLLQRYLALNRRVQTKGAWYSYLPFGDPKQLQQTRTELYGLIEQAVDDCKRGGTDDLPIHNAALNASCLVDYLARAIDDKGEKLPREYLLSNTLALVGAGFVTSSSFLSWLIYALVTYPCNQERLLQELMDHGATAATKWTYEHIVAMPFLDAFVKETQRLHSPSFQAARNAKKDIILPGGYKLPRGSILIPSIPHLHCNPAHWDNADRFDADRWHTDRVKGRHKTTYVPFATGPRGCVGFNVAIQEVKLALAELVYRYQFVNASEDAVKYDPDFIVIRPMNFYAKGVRRTVWPRPQSFSE